MPSDDGYASFVRRLEGMTDAQRAAVKERYRLLLCQHPDWEWAWKRMRACNATVRRVQRRRQQNTIRAALAATRAALKKKGDV